MQTNCILSTPAVCRLSDEAIENTFLPLKNTKSVADCGKFWSRSLARFMRAAQFTYVSSCTRRLLKHFRRKSLQIIRNTDDWWIPVSRDISRTVLWVCSLSSRLMTKSLTVSVFSSVRAMRGLPLPGRLSTVPVSRNFFNSLLTPRFVQLFSVNSSVNLFVVYPLKCKLFLSKSCPRRWIPCCLCILYRTLRRYINTVLLLLLLLLLLIVDKHCSDVSVMWRISGATINRKRK